MAESTDYTHGSTGTKPTSALNFETGEPAPPEEFDWFWYFVISALNDHADLLEAIDSDEDGTVDAAEEAGVASSANSVNGSDVDGQVSSASTADQAKSVEVRNSDPNSPSNGQIWIRSDL